MNIKQIKKHCSVIFFILIMLLSSSNILANDDIERLFDWAQTEYPTLFDTSETTKTFDIWRYRHYPNTNIYLGVNDLNEIYLQGDIFGGQVYIDLVSNLLPLVPEDFVHTQIIAGEGLPAAGFNESFLYNELDTPSISSNGNIVFTGEAKSTETNKKTNAVWTGQPGNIKLVIKADDTIPGLPANILFNKKIIGSDSVPPLITKSGHIAFTASLKGAVSQRDDTILLASVNGEVKQVIREGDPAPGFPEGTTIGAFSGPASSFTFSDAGLVIPGYINGAGLQQALWFWDFNTLSLLAAGHNVIEKDQQLDEAISFPVSGCHFGTFQFPQINDIGDIVVGVGMNLHDTQANCAASSIIKINAPGASVVVDSSTQLFENSSDDAGLNKALASTHLNSAGGISFLNISSGLINNSWYKSNTGNFQLVSQIGETLPDDFTSFLAIHYAIINDNADVVVFGADNENIGYILSGRPRINSHYSGTDQAGASQLSLVAKTGMRPPDAHPTDFFSSITSPVITNKGDILFSATITSAIDGSSSNSVWRASANGELQRLLDDGQIINHNNQEEQLSLVSNSTFNTGIGQATLYSDTGKILTFGRLRGGSNDYIFQTSYY